MIDTDKYEGHTPSEWIVEEGANGDTLVSSLHPNEDGLQTDIALIYSNDIDAKLIADAPLLLAEVKRIQQDTLRVASEWFDSDENEWRRLEQALGLPLTPLSWEGETE
tara:strand:- start:1790 stop:2113 length:324 start_codon:yes stop_codon:yes gene_type:complete